MASKEVKVERKGLYQGVAQWGITGASEMTPSKAAAEMWARLENAGHSIPRCPGCGFPDADNTCGCTPPQDGLEPMDEYERRQRG